MIIGYARDLIGKPVGHHKMLKLYGCDKIYTEAGKHTKIRDLLVGLLQAGDILVVPNLECLRVDAITLSKMLKALAAHQVVLVSIVDQFDTRVSYKVGSFMEILERVTRRTRMLSALSNVETSGDPDVLQYHLLRIKKSLEKHNYAASKVAKAEKIPIQKAVSISSYFQFYNAHTLHVPKTRWLKGSYENKHVPIWRILDDYQLTERDLYKWVFDKKWKVRPSEDTFLGDDKNEFRRLYYAGIRICDMSKILGIGTRSVRKKADRWGLPKRRW